LVRFRVVRGCRRSARASPLRALLSTRFAGCARFRAGASAAASIHSSTTSWLGRLKCTLPAAISRRLSTAGLFFARTSARRALHDLPRSLGRENDERKTILFTLQTIFDGDAGHQRAPLDDAGRDRRLVSTRNQALFGTGPPRPVSRGQYVSRDPAPLQVARSCAFFLSPGPQVLRRRAEVGGRRSILGPETRPGRARAQEHLAPSVPRSRVGTHRCGAVLHLPRGGWDDLLGHLVPRAARKTTFKRPSPATSARSARNAASAERPSKSTSWRSRGTRWANAAPCANGPPLTHATPPRDDAKVGGS